MPVDAARARELLRAFDFRKLFIEVLGWDRHDARLELDIAGVPFALTAVAQKRGMAVFVCGPDPEGNIPGRPTLCKIERQVTKSAHEHIVIYTDASRASQVWQWVRREHGRSSVPRHHAYHVSQPGDLLIQKLATLAVSLEEEEELTLVAVAGRARRAFDMERVTKRFYDRFKAEHAAFLKYLKGIPDKDMERWYVSVMLNRLMFIYFIQKKGFLDGDEFYLGNKLDQCRRDIGKDRYYKDLLCPLFFDGFARRPDDRPEKSRSLLGDVPYLNGGIFMPHQIEQLHGKTIQIPDKAFENLFEFFDAYNWHLDERPLRADNEINPDVLGYIFEKYINQKQMGAYYTKEDITDYIGKNTIIPFLFDAARDKCKVAFEGENSIWRLLQDDPDSYIYEAVRKGADLPLPPEIAAGLDDVSKRSGWNRPAPEEFALPTEIWREVVARRKRYQEIRAKLEAGEIRSINDLITLNLDIRRFAQDVISGAEGPDLLRAFWRAVESVTVLDPTCGSGAFLFAALNILKPLYDACLDRMQGFLDTLDVPGQKHHPEKFSDFRKVIERVAAHPNHDYFVLKSIMVNNLYGVDIMEEATEICKLRLFLKLVAQIERAADIEPLPDIDFNIRAGNTLVGFASLDELKDSQAVRLGLYKDEVSHIEEESELADRAFKIFRGMQTDHGMSPADFSNAKRDLLNRLETLAYKLDLFLAGEYGANSKTRFDAWKKSHQPFHWFTEFYGILKKGGFDVIIGNPPYVEYKNIRTLYEVKGYTTEDCGDLYSFVLERSDKLLCLEGRLGVIVPVSVSSTDGFHSLRRLLLGDSRTSWCAGFAERPSKLFSGVEKRLSIWIMQKQGMDARLFLSKYWRWFSEEREDLFSKLQFVLQGDISGIVGSSLPKVSVPSEVAILKKMVGQRKLNNYFLKNTSCITYYTRKVRYFVQFFDFIPEIYDERNCLVEPSELKVLFHESNIDRDVVIATLNSNLFFWFFSCFSDVRNVNRREIEVFPCSLDKMGSDVKSALCKQSHLLMKDFKKHAKMIENNYGKKGKLTIQSFRPRLSKPIIDEIDRVLAKHYGFTDEELDFIINYDIKYRMGQDMAEDGTE